MAKDPAVLFYTSDFISGTMLMSDEQRGKYIMLLCLQHQQGGLSEEDMLNICKTYDKKIFNKFIKKDDGLYYNERMKIESERRKAYSESRRKNRKTSKTHDTSYVKHMETENKNENKTKDKDKDNKDNKIEERQKLFKEEVEGFVDKYSIELLTAFYIYWSEPNRAKTKMRCEMEKTWKTSGRLATWFNRSKK